MRVSGMRTGLDVEGLVKQLMQVERRPIEALRHRMSQREASGAAWRELSSKLEAFKNLTDKLASSSSYTQRSVEVADASVAVVQAGASAAIGLHNLTVHQLATQHRVESGVFSSSTTQLGYSGTFIIEGAPITITPDDTLMSVSNKIALASVPATCRVVKLSDNQYKLLITSTGSGAISRIAYQDSDMAVYSVSSSAAEVATAEIHADAAAGLYDLHVASLATQESIASDTVSDADQSLGLTGMFSINGRQIQVYETHSLYDIAALVSSSGSGVDATVENGGGGSRLVLTSQETGSAGRMQFGDPDGVMRYLGLLSGNMAIKNSISAAQDATYTINGVSYTSSSNEVSVPAGLTVQLHAVGRTEICVDASGGVLRSLGILRQSGAIANETMSAQDAIFSIDGTTFSRSTNQVTDAVPELNISLKKTGSTDFKVSADHKSLMNQIKDWVQRLNDITEYIRAKSSYDTKSARSGPLTGDSLARELEARLRSSVTSAIVLGDKIGSLADIGISMGKYGTQDAGKLIINTDTLTEKLNQDVGYVMSIFGADELGAASNNGVAKSLLSLAEMYLRNGSGLVSRHTQMIDLTIGNFARQVQDMEARMAKREAELYRKYTRMEVELTRLQNQSAMIGIQMDKLV